MKTIVTALILAAGTAGAFAAEYTNFEIPASVLTRAEVRAAIGSGPRDIAVHYGEATQFALPAAGATQRVEMPQVASDSAPVFMGEATEFPLPSRTTARNATVLSAAVPGRY